MLLFSLVIQPLLRNFSSACDFKPGILYVDDGKFGGCIPEVRKALDILSRNCPLVQYYRQPTRTIGYGRTINPTRVADLVRAHPVERRHDDAGVTISDVRIGSDSCVVQYHIDTSSLIEIDLTLIPMMSAICDERLVFHDPLLCAHACHLTYLPPFSTGPGAAALASI
jgi:hypothetical protein